MTMITPSYLGETIEYSSLHACRSTLEDPTNDAYLYGVIALQAAMMACIGYVPSLALTFGIRAIAADRGVDILITPAGAVFVLILALAICTGAGVVAMQRVTRADPALVFRA